MASLDLLLHPVRLRIVRAMLDGHPSTTAQLRERLPDVAPATMYRHIAALTAAGVLAVVDERQVRGTVERTYQVQWDRAEIDAAERAVMTTDDHRRAFTAFAGGLLSDFDRYLAGERADPTGDGVTYRQAALWLTDEELAELVDELRAAVTARMGNRQDAGRTRRMISVVVMPADG
jgi:DNA-binding transcriptional ArsR family regulator